MRPPGIAEPQLGVLRTSPPLNKQPKALDCCQNYSSPLRTECACKPLSVQARDREAPYSPISQHAHPSDASPFHPSRETQPTQTDDLTSPFPSPSQRAISPPDSV